MKRETDFKAIKEVAKDFAMLPVEETELSPLFVAHPFFESGYVAHNDADKGLCFLSILESDEDLRIAREDLLAQLDKAKGIGTILMYMRDSYHLVFLKYIQAYLSLEDFSTLLAEIWIASENPNSDADVSTKEAADWFRKADKSKMMTKEEQKYYNSLHDELTVYRGVAVGRNPGGLSWTANRQKAEWFANRFNRGGEKGYLLTATVRKEQVLAYFNRRDEDELVIFLCEEDVRRENI